MALLQHFLPHTQQIQLEDWKLDQANTHLSVTVASTQTIAQCPVCGGSSHRVHNHYERTLQDLALAQYSMTLQLQVRKFFCVNTACARRIFTARLGDVAAPWARKTARLVKRLQAVGLALGGAAGERLSHRFGLRVCGSTLLKQLKKLPLPQLKTPKILGVDDFAFRKGKQYGTILVDLERHQPIALLADRRAETLAAWLIQHPGVEVLSRDRSTTYRSGMSQGAPAALQVADRFQLVQNLGETLEKRLSSYSPQLKAIEQQQRQATASTETVVVTPQATATANAQAHTQAKPQRRVQQQQASKKPHQQQWSQTAIAQAVGVCPRTVQRLLELPDLPETCPHRRSLGKSLLNPYKQTLLEWWNEGMRQPKRLVSFLQKQGYTGSERTLTRYISQLRQAQGLPTKRGRAAGSVTKVTDPQAPPLTPRRASYLMVKRQEKREPEDQEVLRRLVAQHPDLASAVG